MSRAKPAVTDVTNRVESQEVDRGSPWHVLLLLIVGILGLGLGWRCWPDPIVDFGHELYIPWRLTAGDVPYRDMELVTGPASQLYHAALFRLFGVSYGVLIVSNLVWLIVLLVVVYDWVRMLSRRWVSLIAGLFLLTVFAFGQYTGIGNYNYMSPYRHEVSHGLLAGLIGIWALQRASMSGQGRWMPLSGICCGLTILMKTEISVPILGAIVWWWVTEIRSAADGRGREIRRLIKLLVLQLSGVLLVLLIAWGGLLATGLSNREAVRGLFAAWSYTLRPELTRGAAFYAAVGGWNHLPENLSSMATMLVLICLVLALLGAADRWITQGAGPRWPVRLAMVIAGGGGFFLGVRFESWKQIVPTFPAVLFVLTVVFSWRMLLGHQRRPKESEGSDEVRNRDRAWGLFSVFSGLTALKMIFLLRIPHYGFALALPATMLAIALLLHALPEWLQLNEAADESREKRSFNSARGDVWRAFGVSLLAGGMVCHFGATLGVWAAKQVVVGSGGDYFWGENFQDRRIGVVKSAIEYLGREMQAEETLAVIPDGTMINYQLRRRNPTPHLLVGPWDMRASGGDAAVRENFERTPPDWIIVTSDDPGIHQMGAFGSSDYGALLADWIRENYANVQDLSDPGGGFGAGYGCSILRRKSR